MSKLTFPAMIFVALVGIDLAVAGFLASAAPASLVRFFDYGRSIPGKLAQWEHTDKPGDLFDVAWRPQILSASTRAFEQELPDTGGVIRGYGMSFVNHILESAAQADPALDLDLHSGPAAPPNFTYALFLDDRMNRRAGDVAVLGILSSSVADMFSFSNRTWAFEQPAPFTYPVFRPQGQDGLARIDPVVESLAEELALSEKVGVRDRWSQQLATEDPIYTRAAFGWPWSDSSPFIRLVRRSAATEAIKNREDAVLAEPESGPTPYGAVLSRMITRFAAIARSDNQLPVVFLIQTRDRTDPPLLKLLRATLKADKIPYLATVEHQDANDFSAFLPDGHYRPAVDARFARAFLDLLRQHDPHTGVP